MKGLGIPAKPASPRCAECRRAFPVPEWRCAECGALLHQARLASHDEVCQDTELLRCGTSGPTPDCWIRGSVACHFCGMRYSWTNVADCEVCGKMFCHGVSDACGYREPRSQRNWACIGLPEPEDQAEVALPVAGRCHGDLVGVDAFGDDNEDPDVADCRGGEFFVGSAERSDEASNVEEQCKAREHRGAAPLAPSMAGANAPAPPKGRRKGKNNECKPDAGPGALEAK